MEGTTFGSPYLYVAVLPASGGGWAYQLAWGRDADLPVPAPTRAAAVRAAAEVLRRAEAEAEALAREAVAVLGPGCLAPPAPAPDWGRRR